MTPEPGEPTIDWVDERLGASPGIRRLLRYVFPEHWTFMFGEIALYAFVVLIGTGVFLALFFQTSTAETTYLGAYAPLHGETMSLAYESTLNLSLNVPAGLLMRQTHHWAALIFIAAIVVHLMRVFFTAAFRKPRDVNWVIGLTMLVLALLEGFAGYSMPDDLLSGMGLAIAYSVAMSIPLVGANLAFLVWGGEFPGSNDFVSRLFIAHVFVIPALLGLLIAAHLAIIMRQHHSQFRGPGRTERNVVGAPMWPGYALRSLGLLAAVAAVLFLLGGLVQINPIWQWGPYEVYNGTNGAQPDWYLGWLIGALRMMPPWEIHFWGDTWVPNPFFGGVLFPGIVFAILYAIPWLDRRFTRDRRRHDLLERPRDNPTRTALGVALFTWVAFVFGAGATDRVLIRFGFPYESQIQFARVATFLVPLIAFFVARKVCRDLQRSEAHPLRGWSGRRLRRTPDGGFEPVEPDEERTLAGEPPAGGPTV
ncbi:MAG: ubiquinol-cytochrome c reductase cytochrome b subunit [Conexibacter sp.]|nr:ubiquinol-cytochrome c reductase cytochrome b subunit [Conexibacter sp.]